MSVIPADELPALVEDGMSHRFTDLTLVGTPTRISWCCANSGATRNIFASLKAISAAGYPLNSTMPQVLANRTPIQLLRLFQGKCEPDSGAAGRQQRMEDEQSARRSSAYVQWRMRPCMSISPPWR